MSKTAVEFAKALPARVKAGSDAVGKRRGSTHNLQPKDEGGKKIDLVGVQAEGVYNRSRLQGGGVVRRRGQTRRHLPCALEGENSLWGRTKPGKERRGLALQRPVCTSNAIPPNSSEGTG